MTLTIITIICLGLIAWCALPRRSPVGSGVVQSPPEPGASVGADGVRIATFNIHGARGTDGVRDVSRITRILEDTDIAALQEVHAGWRSNQAAQITRGGDCGAMFVPTLRRWLRDRRGNGLLTRFPVSRWQTVLLPNLSGHRYRVFTVAEIPLGEQVVSLLFTHLTTRQGRDQQLKIVLDRFRSLPLPAVLAGDLNITQDDPVLKQHLPPDCIDAVAQVLGTEDPENRVDCILTRGLAINDGGYAPVGASDHPCFWVDVSLVFASGSEAIQ